MDFSDFENKKYKFGIVGLGLIGGSLAKALREVFANSIIVAFNRREEPRKMAFEEHVADIVTGQIDDSFMECDYIFLCTPVEYNEDYLKKLIPYISEKTIITDVGSTKTSIHEEVEKLDIQKNFIGGHPMAGSEKTGYEFSNLWLFKNAFYAITPTEETDEVRLLELQYIATMIGAKPVVIDYKEHDYAVAGISHLPHLVASAMTNLVKEKDTKNQMMHKLAANGFKDSTRIAASSPEMWEQICMTNTENIALLVDEYISKLQEMSERLKAKDGDYIHKMFEDSREYRQTFGNRLSGNPNDL